MAQVSDGFSYQSVVRDASGNLLSNQLIGLRMTLLANSALGTADYVETHQVATNGYGVVSISVGTGTVVSGVFNNVDWINNTYFLKTELDISGGTNYVFMGISQILAVPYALHAQTASSVLGDNDTSATNEIQQLSIVGNQLVLDNGGNSVTLSGTIDLDADPTNELQALNISNDTLYLSQGNYILIDNYLQSLSNTAGTISISGNNTITLADSSATNEIQNLSSTAGTITLSSANTIVLADSSATNELQTLIQTAGTISLSNGNTITLQDSSSINELQTLSNTAGTITISDGNTITMADSSATNELQVLTNTAGTITISDGNTITLADSSAINEIQVLSRSNDTLYLTDGGFAVLPKEIDSDTTNELQTLSYSNDTLSISNGNNVALSSSSFDFIYPDGKTGLIPIFLNAGSHNLTIPRASWLSLKNNYCSFYTVPNGKNLYITSIFSSDQYHDYKVAEIWIDNNLIFRGPSSSNSESFNKEKYSGLSQPIILGAGQILKLVPPNNENSSNTSSDIQLYKSALTGFLVDSSVTPITTALQYAGCSTCGINKTYTVPNDKILVILNICSNLGSIRANGTTILHGTYNWNHDGITSIVSGLDSPIILDENTFLNNTNSSYIRINSVYQYFPKVFLNGYLIDK